MDNTASEDVGRLGQLLTVGRSFGPVIFKNWLIGPKIKAAWAFNERRLGPSWNLPLFATHGFFSISELINSNSNRFTIPYNLVGLHEKGWISENRWSNLFR